MSSARSLIVGIYASLAQGDIPAILAAMHPSIEWNEAEGFVYAEGNPYRGPEAVLNGVFARLGSEWDGFQATPTRFTAGEDTVIAEGRYTGTFKTTGRAVDAQFAHVWRIRDGKVMGFQQYTDTGQFQRVVQA